MNKKNTEKTEEMIRALDNTGVRMFMYYPASKKITIPEKTCLVYYCRSVYTNMPYSFATDYVAQEDWPVFEAMYERIDQGEKSASATFHSKDHRFCNHVTLTTISWNEDGTPSEVFGLIENWSDLYKNKQFIKKLQAQIEVKSKSDETDHALKIIASAIGSQYYAVYYIWLNKRSYICFQEQLEGILSVIGESGDYVTAWDQYIRGYIEEEDQDSLRAFVEIETLAQRIGKKNSISIVYRRKEVGWTRGQFIVGTRDENGLAETLIYTVSDINEEIETKLQKESAEEEALRDSLTGLYNRKAFDLFKKHREYKSSSVGVLVFDVDRFKAINDEFGHEAGDTVLKEVAQAVSSVLRPKDLIFRIGGDEFAVLLYNCLPSIFNAVCKKLENVHELLRNTLPHGMSVTLSAGLCVHENGYSDEMFTRADQAMYNTKINGRGGCTFINTDAVLLGSWHDQSSYIRKGDVLEKNSTVTWRLDLPKKPGLKRRAYGDELFCAFVGLGPSATPEELYDAWYARVEKDNYDILREAARTVRTDGSVEVVFEWIHPSKGKIKLRCSASFESENEEYWSFIGYSHVLTGTRVITMEDIDAKIKNALEELYFCNFYIRLKDYSFRVHKAQPYMADVLKDCVDAKEAIKLYITSMVAKESKASLSRFLDLSTLKERMKDSNILEGTYNDPNIGWSRAKFITVDRDERGEVQNVLLVVESMTGAKLFSKENG